MPTAAPTDRSSCVTHSRQPVWPCRIRFADRVSKGKLYVYFESPGFAGSSVACRRRLLNMPSAGHPVTPAQQEGFGAWQTTHRNGLRCSAADAYLRPASHVSRPQKTLENANIKLRTQRPGDNRGVDRGRDQSRRPLKLAGLAFRNFLPLLRASERPIAMACLRLLTVLPLRPLLSVRRLRLLIALLTVFAEPREYRRAITSAHASTRED
jgi:hypothetical protein